MGVSVASWAAAVAVIQVVVGVEIGGATRRLEERIELQLKSRGTVSPDSRQPERTHEEEPIEPWELVGV
jgi:hypothetical protein